MIRKQLPLIAIFLFMVCSCSTKKSGWQPLFNGKDLTGWDTYLGPRYDTIRNETDTLPIGLNTDPANVFTVVKLDNENVIRISGENFGGISTTNEFENYHLQLQFRWGQLKWAPRKKSKKDSGLMYHAVGPQGADGGNWMRSQEFQIQEGDCGDYWACAGAIGDVRARKESENSYIYEETGSLFTFSTLSRDNRNCKKFPDAEKPDGEWNTLDLYCFGSTSIHVVNGVVNMIINNSRQFEGDKEIPLIKGKIQIQSEGSEVLYRNIKIKPLKGLPKNLQE